jgi:ABC-type lipoprotein export system ATPase subunit
MIKLSKKLKNDILNLIITQGNSFGDLSSGDGILYFLSKIWDLRIMPSTDGRYNDAYGDIYQHMVNNDDWDYEYLFITRLEILENDDVFQRFLQMVINPDIRKTEDSIMKFYLLINPYLEKENYGLFITDYTSEELPVYEIKDKKDIDQMPIGIKQNNIPFFVVLNSDGRADRASSHQSPTEFPSFVLVLNNGWNDYGMNTEFNLFYYLDANNYEYIGEVKIINLETNIIEVIDEKFTILNENYCSLGQEFNYYNNLKSKLGKNFESILWALKDAAFYPEIQDKFEQESAFINSLIRYDGPEQLLREAKYKIYDYDLSNLYSFKYTFSPKFSDTSLDIDFNFNNNGNFPDRIYAIIGKNGTGKTQLMTSLPIDIYKKADENFTPKTPMFSRVIAVSYSAFDTFEIPKKTATFNYLYCGLKDENGERMTDRALLLRFHNTWKKIKKQERMSQWVKILSNFLDKEIIDEFIILKKHEFEVSLDGFTKTRKMLSSGQSILLYIITEIVANIRYDAIILYDEPETHLHPNAITQLMNTIYELVNEFQSYCIIATHSPLIIRELLSKNVFVMERESNYPSLRKIGIETFGENLTVLTEEVFGNRSIPKQYKLILERLVNNGMSYDEIINELESDDVPLSLNARMYLKTIVDEKS